MEDDCDLVHQLLTRAGIVMEDVHPAAIVDDGTLTMGARIAAVRQAGETLLTLANAAERLWHSSARAADDESS
jgi:hypothetical protein